MRPAKIFLCQRSHSDYEFSVFRDFKDVQKGLHRIASLKESYSMFIAGVELFFGLVAGAILFLLGIGCWVWIGNHFNRT